MVDKEKEIGFIKTRFIPVLGELVRKKFLGFLNSERTRVQIENFCSGEFKEFCNTNKINESDYLFKISSWGNSLKVVLEPQYDTTILKGITMTLTTDKAL